MSEKAEVKRCVIYVRKSLEEGLDQEYNSLDAQEDACKAYISSQTFNGWQFTGKVYSDGGFSGGTMERPALKELLADLEEHRFDILVVYKIDRFSRSLCDFTNMTRMFEENHASFVSVTQNIDTSNAMGKMILNVLMSFAQFEREMTSERIHDKVVATRKKGIWIGGLVPYGYQVVDKKLEIEPNAANAVKRLFALYADGVSLPAIAAELESSGAPKKGGTGWTRQRLFRLLGSHYYIGEFKAGEEWVPGKQPPIIDRELFDRVQERRNREKRTYAKGSERTIHAPLRGLLRCGECDSAMFPYFARKGKTRRYYYYRCAKENKRLLKECPIKAVSGPVIEDVVFREIGKILSASSFVEVMSKGDPAKAAVIRRSLSNIPKFWADLFPTEKMRILELMLAKAELFSDRIVLHFRAGGLRDLAEELNGATVEGLHGEDLVVTVPCHFVTHSGVRSLVVDSEGPQLKSSPLYTTVTTQLARGFKFRNALDTGLCSDMSEVADRYGYERRSIAKYVKAALLSPDIVHAIIAGELPNASMEKIAKIDSPLWYDQRVALGLEKS